MKRTTIFLPDDLHESLRRDAFRAKVSMAQLVRMRLQTPTPKRSRGALSGDPILKVAGVCRGPVLSTEIDKELYGG